MSRRLLVTVVSIAVALTIALLTFTVAHNTYKRARPVSWAERQAQEVVLEFPDLSETDARALDTELCRAQTRDEFDSIVSRWRQQYFARMIRRKLAGEHIDRLHYQRLLATITEHPEDVDPADLRALLSNTSEQEDRQTYITCLQVMGASGNREFTQDVRAHLPNYWALKPYAQLARAEAIPVLLRYVYVGSEFRNSGPQEPVQEQAIEALGVTGDPDVLPILNHVGERQQVHRRAVERALYNINHPAAVTVAANMLSLPTDYPNTYIGDEGRWHSNEHSAARNVLLTGAERFGLLAPSKLGPQDLKFWWESNQSKFPSLESVRADFPRVRDKFLRGEAQR